MSRLTPHLGLVAVLTAALGASSCYGDTMTQVLRLDPHNPELARPIAIATERLKAKGLDPQGYRVAVMRRDEHLIISFVDAGQSRQIRGSQGKPAYEVELSPTLTIVRENFAR